MAGRPGSRAAQSRRGTSGAGGGATPPEDGDTFRTPPLPLASGNRLPDPDGRAVRAVDLVVTTEDGEQTRIGLVPGHGAWWAPAPPRA